MAESCLYTPGYCSWMNFEILKTRPNKDAVTFGFMGSQSSCWLSKLGGSVFYGNIRQCPNGYLVDWVR